ncbi:MAG: hypothetical protein WAU11_00705 [Ignavibacteriaceae bacterium]
MITKYLIAINLLISLVACEVTDPNLVLSTSSTYRFNVSEPSNVKVNVINSYNTFIVTLVDSFYNNTGIYEVHWNFEDQNKNKIVEGTYYIELYINQKFVKRSTYIVVYR